MRLSVPFFSIASYILIFIAVTLVKPPPDDPLEVLAIRSDSMLQAYAPNDRNTNRSVMKEASFSSDIDLSGVEELFFEVNRKVYGHGRESLTNAIIKKMMTGVHTLLLSQHIGQSSVYNATIASNASRVNGLLLAYELAAKAVQMVLEPLNQTLSTSPDNTTLLQTHQQLS